MAYLLVFIISFVNSLFKAFVFKSLWLWFIFSQGLSSIQLSTLQAWGIIFVIDMLRTNFSKERKDLNDLDAGKIAEILFVPPATYLIFYVFGRILYGFI